jgi:UDP-N-acetylglucosamine 2-epimerase (non-hydrolysing)
VSALEQIATAFPVVFPIHPRTQARLENLRISTSGVTLSPPLAYAEFLSLEAGAGAVVTDSGGVQEETTALGIPCFTLRDNTERPVTITHGTNTLLGLNPERLVEIPDRLEEFTAPIGPPLWDGYAGARAAVELERMLEVGLEAAA